MKYILLAALIASPSAHAGGWDIGKSLRQLGDAAADAATLGHVGRERDKARAQAREREAQQAREAAEREKQARIASLNSNKQTFTNMIGDLSYVSQSLEGLQSEFAPVVAKAISEFTSRGLLKNSIWPGIRSYWTGESEYSNQLLSLLDESNQEMAALLNQAHQANSDEALKTLSRSQSALKRLREVAAANEQELNVMLTRAVQYLDDDKAGQLVSLLAENEDKVKKLKEFVDVRKSHYENELASVNNQLKELGQ